MIETGLGEWMSLKGETKRIYYFDVGEPAVITDPVKMQYVRSGHEIVDAEGNSTVIITNHSDEGRQHLLYYRIFRK